MTSRSHMILTIETLKAELKNWVRTCANLKAQNDKLMAYFNAAAKEQGTFCEYMDQLETERQDLREELSDLNGLFEALRRLTLPGEMDSVDAMVKIKKERDDLLVEVHKLRRERSGE